MKEKTKKELIRVGIIFAFMLFIMIFVILSIYLQKDTSEKQIMQMIEKYLFMSLDEEYVVEKKLKLNTGFSESLVFYELKQGNKTAIVSLARITGFSGPQTCLFFSDEEDFDYKFISICGLVSDGEYLLVENYLDYGITESILNYWLQIIKKIIHEGVLS